MTEEQDDDEITKGWTTMDASSTSKGLRHKFDLIGEEGKIPKIGGLSDYIKVETVLPMVDKPSMAKTYFIHRDDFANFVQDWYKHGEEVVRMEPISEEEIEEELNGLPYLEPEEFDKAFIEDNGEEKDKETA